MDLGQLVFRVERDGGESGRLLGTSRGEVIAVTTIQAKSVVAAMLLLCRGELLEPHSVKIHGSRT